MPATDTSNTSSQSSAPATPAPDLELSAISPRALTPRKAAEYCGISEAVLKEARMNGKRANRMDAPRATKLGPRKVVYLIDDLDEWLEKKRASTEYFDES